MILQLSTSSIVAGNPAEAQVIKDNFDKIQVFSQNIDEQNFATLTGALNWEIATDKSAISITSASSFPAIYIESDANAPAMQVSVSAGATGTNDLIRLVNGSNEFKVTKDCTLELNSDINTPVIFVSVNTGATGTSDLLKLVNDTHEFRVTKDCTLELNSNNTTTEIRPVADGEIQYVNKGLLYTLPENGRITVDTPSQRFLPLLAHQAPKSNINSTLKPNLIPAIKYCRLNIDGNGTLTYENQGIGFEDVPLTAFTVVDAGYYFNIWFSHDNVISWLRYTVSFFVTGNWWTVIPGLIDIDNDGDSDTGLYHTYESVVAACTLYEHNGIIDVASFSFGKHVYGYNTTTFPVGVINILWLGFIQGN